MERASVRSGSDFWASPNAWRTSASTTGYSASPRPGPTRSSDDSEKSRGRSRRRERERSREEEDDNDGNDSDADSQGTEKAGSSNSGQHVPASATDPGARARPEQDALDEIGAQDAFVAGMIYALSRQLVPGAPYSPGLEGSESKGRAGAEDMKRWRLDECLRCVSAASYMYRLIGYELYLGLLLS